MLRLVHAVFVRDLLPIVGYQGLLLHIAVVIGSSRGRSAVLKCAHFAVDFTMSFERLVVVFEDKRALSRAGQKVCLRLSTIKFSARLWELSLTKGLPHPESTFFCPTMKMQASGC